MLNLDEMSQMKILLIEKDSELRDELVNEFIKEGSSIIAVESAREALECLKEERFNVIISDFVSAATENLKLIKMADIHFPDTVTIGIVSSGGLDSCPSLESCGIDDIIRKPFPFVSLTYTISKLIEEKQASRSGHAMAAG